MLGFKIDHSLKQKFEQLCWLIFFILFPIINCNAFNSQDAYENYVTNQSGSRYMSDYDSCTKLNKFYNVFNSNELYNVYMPDSINQDHDISATDRAIITAQIVGPIIARAILYGALLATIVVPTSALLLAGSILTETIILLDVCTNVYVLQPHEYANFLAANTYGWGSFIEHKSNAGKHYNGAPCAATAHDIPYYFQCADNTQPAYSPHFCDPYACDNINNPIYRQLGCTRQTNVSYPPSGTGSALITANCSSTANPVLKPDSHWYTSNSSFGQSFTNMVGSVVFAHDGGQGGFLNRGLFGATRTRYRPQALYALNPTSGSSVQTHAGSTGSSPIPRPSGRSAWISQIPSLFTSFYRVDSNTGYISACVIAPLTFIPVLIGCAPVAPPLEEVTYSPTFAYRCLYLTQPRSDLNGVGTAILSGNLPNGFVGSYSIPIARFLKSSFHYTSTMVGCVQDMISVTLTQNIATSRDSTFLQIVQNSLRPFILGTLVLYVALVGIKIMMSQGELKRHEYIMFLVKFAMVMWMNTTSFWYISQNTAPISSNDGPTGNSLATATAGYGSSGLGVFNALIQGQNVISSMFVQSLTTYDPLGLCTYYYGDSQRQLLSDTTNIPPSAATGMAKTNGYGYVNMTVWDMIDCKLANYLNYGSCQYDGIGILLAFFLGLCSLLIPDSVWLLMFLCAFGYLLIGIVYKMARISILVSIVIATLVITSPVFTCFMLFDKTMPIFQAWVKALIGYLLFPGFIMAFFCLTVLTLDSVYYGNLTLPVTPGITRTQQLVQACQGSNSIFCATVSIMGDPCNNDISNYPSQYSLMGSFIGMLLYPMMNPQVMAAYFLPILRITLMILLFSLLTDSSIAFLSTLAGTSGIETVASGGVLAGLKDSIFGPLLKSVAKMGGSKKG